MTLNPIFFGASNRKLFGIYDPSVSGGQHGVVLCAPWGQEYLRAHPSLRHLARLLARSGVHAFRFDYYGTGDSEGTDLDGNVRQWLEDANTAIEELKDTAGVRHVSLVGLRLGATVASIVAAKRRDIHRLVLWDPITDGAAYLSELVTPRDIARLKAPLQIRGFQVSDTVHREVAAIGLETYQAKLPRTLILSTESLDACSALETSIRQSGTDVVSEFRGGPRAWVEVGHFGAAGMPVAALQAITQWLAA